MTARAWTCGACGATGTQHTPGHPRKWCSDRCRKSQYDGACIDCGKRTSGTDPGQSTGRCMLCANATRDHSAFPQVVAARERRERVVVLWRDGLTMLEICEVIGWTRNSLGGEISRMRQAGYDLPYRYARRKVAA